MQFVHKCTQNIKNKVLLTCNYSKAQVMKRLQVIKILVFSFIILISTTSCTKDDVNDNKEFAEISVSLKSTTNNLNKVYLDIEDVQLRVKEDADAPNAWVSLDAINTGTHNVSDLKDDFVLSLVSYFEIKSAYIYEIRLVLDDNNFIDINQTLFSLDIAEIGNATPSNLVNIAFESNRIYDIVINLNLEESISFNETENMMVLHPKLYTEIRQIQY